MNKKVYTSNYTDKPVTGAQYLAEFICIRIAARENKNLPYKFWNYPEWKKIFLRQLGEANKLLGELPLTVIMDTLRSYKGRKIYSLGLRRQILEYSKNVNFHPNGILPTSPEDDFVENIENVEEILPVEPKMNLWTKLS